MAVVVVESPAKAKTINKYLGPGYTVLASYGHVRDLPAKDGSVDPDHDFAMKWEVAPDSAEAHPRHRRGAEGRRQADPRHRPRPRGRGDLLAPARGADRPQGGEEGHRRSSASSSTPSPRTRSPTAMENPRQIDMELVDAYLARRALDYLVGFKLSPVLWRKLPGSRSAGRVQSVALRLIVDREMEIEAFRAREYWTVKALLATPRGDTYEARLVSLDGTQARQVRPRPTPPPPTRAVAAIEARDLTVAAVESKPATRNPARAVHDLDAAAGGEPQVRLRRAPDDERRPAALRGRPHHLHAHRRHRHGARGGDGRPRRDHAPATAPTTSRRRPRMYKNKAKNAQEAHECIRPTDMAASPGQAARSSPTSAKLYDLIWKRSIAEPDGGRALRAHHRRRRQRRRARSACAPPARS